MRPELNPFTPGSGLRPPHLAGRDDEVSSFDLLVARTLARRNGASFVLHGYRGVGKTVLLNAMRAQAANAGWLVIDVEAQTSEAGPVAIRQQIARKLHTAADVFKNGKPYSEAIKKAFRTLTGFSLSLGGVVTVEAAREPVSDRGRSGLLEVDLEELVEDFAPALKESGSAIGIFIDEMQDVDDELLSALLTVQNRAGQKGIPFYVVGAGLPTLPARLSTSRSYAERLFEYRHIGALDEHAAIAAIRDPFTRHNFRVDEEALNLLTRAAKGYPYFLQLFGREAWNITTERRITADVAQGALRVAYRHLDQGYFRSSWDRADTAERSILRYMAAAEGSDEYRLEDVSAGCGLSQDDFQSARQSLTRKAVLFDVGPGRIAFTTPGMPGHVQRRAAESV